jgi:tRNA (guanine26-N2/guanine27-N2)-dimethyltransferase
LKLPCPSLVEFRSAILNSGHRVSLSHCCKQSIKTDAPPAVLWDIMRCFAQKQFPNKAWPRPLPTEGTASAADRILSQESQIKVDFTIHPQANPESRKQKLVRFQENPEKNWGPKARAKSR